MRMNECVGGGEEEQKYTEAVQERGDDVAGGSGEWRVEPRRGRWKDQGERGGRKGEKERSKNQERALLFPSPPPRLLDGHAASPLLSPLVAVVGRPANLLFSYFRPTVAFRD